MTARSASASSPCSRARRTSRRTRPSGGSACAPRRARARCSSGDCRGRGLAACWLCLASDAPLEYRADASGEALGWLAHPLVTACAPVRTGPGGVFRARFALAFAATEREALDSARRALGCGAGKLADLPSALGALYGADAAARGLPELAARLCFPRVEGGGTARGALWALGVPGDFPIICARVSKDGEDAARRP